VQLPLAQGPATVIGRSAAAHPPSDVRNRILDPRWVRATTVQYGRQRSHTVTNRSEGLHRQPFSLRSWGDAS
jgi:hypothetical protein